MYTVGTKDYHIHNTSMVQLIQSGMKIILMGEIGKNISEVDI